jgi:hypothetical protein
MTVQEWAERLNADKLEYPAHKLDNYANDL